MKAKEIIIKTLEGRGFVWGGQLSREIHEIIGQKESIIERRCRELAKTGILEARYEQVDGEGPRCVMYKLASMKIFPHIVHKQKLPSLFF